MSLTFSNSDRWFHCAASETPDRHEGRHLDNGTDEQIEGRAAAWIAAGVLNGDAASVDEYLGEISPGGWTITPDMIEHVRGYVDLVQRYGPASAERDLSLFNGLVNGRPDNHTVDHDGVLHVFELKYGYRVIEPAESIQLKLGARAVHAGQSRIMLHVYQPRAYHPAGVHRSHEMHSADLEAFTVEAFKAVNAVLITPWVAKAGPHCTYCPRRTACATLQNDIAAVIEFVSVPENRDRALTAVELKQRHEFLERAHGLIKSALAGVDGEIETRLRSHEFLPGFYMGERYSRDRQWTVPVAALVFEFGPDIMKTVPRTPAEMEREGAPKEAVKRLSQRQFIGHEPKKWNSNDVKRWFKD